MVSIDDPTTFLAGALIVLMVMLGHYTKRSRKYPPAPLGLPLVGYAPFLGKNPAETLMKLKKKYGPVMSIQMGRDVWIVLNDYNTIYEALVKQGEAFSGRPTNVIFETLMQGLGLAGADYGRTWKSLRRFGLKTLRGFGVGKKGMEVNIIEETSYLLDNLASKRGKENLRRKVDLAVSNIVSRIVFGSRFEYNDERFKAMLQATEDILSDRANANVLAAILFAPTLRHFPGFRDTFKYLLQRRQDIINFLRELLIEHKTSYVENDIRDFIDAFLKEMDEKDENDPAFTEGNILQYILDLFVAGTGTTSSTILWAIFTFCHFPDTQKKIADEVEKVVGSNGTPTMNHRDQMPYTCAFIQEIMRLKTLAPLALLHKTNEETIMGGYAIPKDTIIAPNLWSVHHDPETFTDPDSFRPERFLDENRDFVKSSHVIPFSVGPRHCIGEQLAKMEVFIFLISIVQRFKIVPDPKFDLPHYEEFSFTNGFTHESPEFEVICQKR